MIQSIAKHFRILKALARASLQASLEYRANFVTKVISDTVWYFIQIVTFETIYLYIPKFGDWTVQQSRVFLGVLFVTDALYMVLFHTNFESMSERVVRGDLDLILVKPVNSQFLMSVQRLDIPLIGNLMIAMGWLFFSISNLPDFEWTRLVWIFLMLPVGMAVLYNSRFLISTAAVIFTKAENLQYIWYQIYRLGMRPDSAYAPWLRYVLWTILPVSMVASVPARFLLGPPDWGLLALSLFIAGGSLYLSHRFWNYALKFYSSASS